MKMVEVTCLILVFIGAVLVLVQRYISAGMTIFFAGVILAIKADLRLLAHMKDDGISWSQAHFIPWLKVVYGIKRWRKDKLEVFSMVMAALVMVLGLCLFLYGAIAIVFAPPQ